MSISICIKHDVELVPTSKTHGVCPVDGEIFVLSHITSDEYASAFPGASDIKQAYDPRWNASTTEHFKEITDKYSSRKW